MQLEPTMSGQTQVRPTLLQSNLCTTLLVLLSVLVSPVTFLIVGSSYVLSWIQGEHLGARRSDLQRASRRKTILVTGVRANKALTLIRAFKREGHRVIAAEEEKWGRHAMSRFSRGVDSYHLLADPHTDPDGYIDDLKRIVEGEHVDAWVPSSSVQATMVDSEAARQIRLEQIGGLEGCDCFIPEPIVAGTLHWKDQFEGILKALHLPTPDSKIVTSVAEAAEFLHSPNTLAKGHRYLLKCLTLDDLGRDDFTLFPLATREETERHLSNVPTPLSAKDPFLLQQFLHGQEYCTHVAARDGRIVAFVACRSNQLLMRYADVANLGEQERDMGRQLEEWSQHFLNLYKAKLQKEGKTGREYELTGHFSFDFIYEVNEQTLYALECNVRAHTAIALLSNHPTLASYYLGTSDTPNEVTIAHPPLGTPAQSWIAHALPITTARYLPRCWCPLLHPQLSATTYPPQGFPDPTASPFPNEGLFQLLARYVVDGTEEDAVWDWTDPMPFFALCHITWPLLLLNRMWRGVAWSRVNVSTSRVFEC